MERGLYYRRGVRASNSGLPAELVILAVLLVALLLAPAAFAAVPEEPLTEAATGVTATEATLHGLVNPHSSGPVRWQFAYNAFGGCSEGSRTEVHPEESQPEVAAQAIAVTQAVGGLEPNREYTFCALATHQPEGKALETTFGQPLTFKTLTEPPAIEFEAVSGVTPFTARLEAFVNPQNDTTTCHFEYGPTTAYGTTVPCEPVTLGGIGGQEAARTIENLTPGSTVHFRTVLENQASDKTEGKDQSFTTPGSPEPVTGASSSMTSTIADVAGSVNPQGAATTFHFVYVEAAKYRPGAGECPGGVACAYAEGMRSEQSASVGEGHEPIAINGQLRELRPSTTYHYALVATNAAGTVVGADMTVTTAPALPPLVTTGEASVSGPSSATITGSIATRERTTTFNFELGTSPEAALTLTGTVTRASGETLAISASLSGSLLPGTTYWYRLLASNFNGDGSGEWRTFTTPAIPGAPAPAPAALISWPPFVTTQFAGLGHEPSPPPSAPPPTKLTNKQLLAKALKACNKKPRRKRAACRRQAKRRYR